MGYSVLIDPRVIEDTQSAIDYYESQQIGLGVKFEANLNSYIKKLQTTPFFRIRYDKVRCLPLGNFPFMIHYTINEKEKLVLVWAILHTSISPSKWKKIK